LNTSALYNVDFLKKKYTPFSSIQLDSKLMFDLWQKNLKIFTLKLFTIDLSYLRPNWKQYFKKTYWQADKALFSEWNRRDQKGRVLERHSNAVWEASGQWNSPRSFANYPTGFLIRVGNQEFRLQTLMQDQEVDARASTGGFFYEGAIEMSHHQVAIGRGYLELTGYSQAVKLWRLRLG